MEGQISIDDLIGAKLRVLEEQYPIPRLSRQIREEEGWFDDWHYTQIEEPLEIDAYYAIELFGDCYIYSYWYWTDRWYKWNSSFFEWREARDEPFAWVKIPIEYRRRDMALKRKLENVPIRWIGEDYDKRKSIDNTQ